MEEEYDFTKPLSRHFGTVFTIKSDKIYKKGFEFNDLFFAENIQKVKLPKKIEYGITREKTENTEIALVEIIIPDIEQYQNGISFAWYNSRDKTIFVNNTILANFVGFILDKIEHKNDKLLCKEFENSSLDEVYDKVFFETAIHELGHQANDLSYYLTGEDSEWKRMDDERFSKLCELIYGKAEYLSLHNTLRVTSKDIYKCHNQANESIKQEIFNILANNKTQYQNINFDNLKEKPEDELVKLTRQEIRQIATQIMEKFEEEKKELIRTGLESVEGSKIYNRTKDIKRCQEIQAPTAVTQSIKNQLKRYRQQYKEIYEKIYGK